jgi:hypothetical protein
VHDRDEEIGDLGELLAEVGELIEQAGQSLQVLEVLVSLCAGGLDLLLELAEGASVGRLVLLEELKDLLDAL